MYKHANIVASAWFMMRNVIIILQLMHNVIVKR